MADSSKDLEPPVWLVGRNLSLSEMGTAVQYLQRRIAAAKVLAGETPKKPAVSDPAGLAREIRARMSF